MMRDAHRAKAKLQRANAELERRTGELESAHWLRASRLGLLETLRGEPAANTIGEATLQALVTHCEARVGALYRAGPAGELDFCAGHALPSGFTPRALIPPGQGILGQVASTQTAELIADVTPDRMRLEGALWDAAPLETLVVPLVGTDGRTHGVAELAAFHRFTPAQRECVDLLAETAGSLLEAASARERRADLFEEVQRQSEELRAQQEELRQTNAELEEQATQLRESERRLKTQQEELRKTNEELLDQTRRLEQAHHALGERAADLAVASKYKSEFLSNMSHELRTPLNSVLLLSRLMAENKDQNLTADQVSWARTMYSAGSDLLLLINDILDLSKVEAGLLQIDSATIETASLADDLRQTFGHVAEDQGLSFAVDVVEEAPPYIESDRQRVLQVVRNLLSNAFKFTETGGVRVRFGVAEPSTLAIAVSDTGPGVAPERQQQIFEAFRQADGTIGRRYGGTGLGLTISRALAQLLGGRLELETEEGHGATFTLVLPPRLASVELAASAPPTTPGSARSAKPVHSPYVLVIDDDPVFAEVLSNLVRARGLECVVTRTGRQGLDRVAQRPPRGILLGWRLPDMSGAEVLDGLRATARGREVPVHVISATDVEAEAHAHGAITVLEKPLSDATVANLLGTLARGARSGRVLVVEDNEEEQLAIAATLQGIGAALTQVSTGGEALRLLAEDRFACVIVDIGLPDMSGFDVLERMPPGDARVVVYTGRELTEDEEARVRRFSDSIIVKGGSPPERLLEDVTLFVRGVGGPHRARARTAHVPEAALQGRTVLVVDDDIRNVFALSASLESAGLQVVIARNGLEGVQRVEQDDRIELVLMDLMMPIMDGYEAMRRIRKDLGRADLPIIAVTAKAMKGDASQCFEAGADDYLAKPVDLERLLSMIRVWLARRPRA